MIGPRPTGCSPTLTCIFPSPTSRQVSVGEQDRKSTRLNSSHLVISYAVFCLKKKNANVISVLMQEQRNTVTTAVTSVRRPVASQGCLADGCGSCTMTVTGRVLQAGSERTERV